MLSLGWHMAGETLMLRELLSSVQMMFMRLNPLSHSAVLTGKDPTELMKRCIGPVTEAHRRSYD